MHFKKIAIAAVLLALASVPLLAGGHLRYIATLWMIYAIAAVGLQIPIGLAAVYSFGHSVFMLLGAYAVGLCVLHAPGLQVPLGLVLGIVLSVAVAMLLALPSLRLSSFGLAIVTMGAASLFFQGVRSFDFTGGPQGLNVPPVPLVQAWGGRAFYLLSVLLLVLGCVVARCVERGRIGRGLRAAAANPLMAQSFGVHLLGSRTLAFALSAVYGAIAGGLLGLSTGYIAPEAYSPELSIQIFAAVMIGGSGRYWGPILGALFIVLIPEVTQSVQNVGPIIYSVLFIAVATLYPGGLQQMISHLLQPRGRAAT